MKNKTIGCFGTGKNPYRFLQIIAIYEAKRRKRKARQAEIINMRRDQRLNCPCQSPQKEGARKYQTAPSHSARHRLGQLQTAIIIMDIIKIIKLTVATYPFF